MLSFFYILTCSATAGQTVYGIKSLETIDTRYGKQKEYTLKDGRKVYFGLKQDPNFPYVPQDLIEQFVQGELTDEEFLEEIKIIVQKFKNPYAFYKSFFLSVGWLTIPRGPILIKGFNVKTIRDLGTTNVAEFPNMLLDTTTKEYNWHIRLPFIPDLVRRKLFNTERKIWYSSEDFKSTSGYFLTAWDLPLFKESGNRGHMNSDLLQSAMFLALPVLDFILLPLYKLLAKAIAGENSIYAKNDKKIDFMTEVCFSLCFFNLEEQFNLRSFFKAPLARIQSSIFDHFFKNDAKWQLVDFTKEYSDKLAILKILASKKQRASYVFQKSILEGMLATYDRDLVNKLAADFANFADKKKLDRSASFGIFLLGEPGVGKTALIKGIKDVFDFDFLEVFLEKENPEEFFGTKDKLGVLTTRLVASIAKSKKLIVFFDEAPHLIKNDVKWKGIFLRLLDRNSAGIHDEFLGINLPLGDVLFCFAANYKFDEPALMDRLNLRVIPAYNLEKKMEIVRKKILPDYLKKNGTFSVGNKKVSLTIKDFSAKDFKIIEDYLAKSNESGMRGAIEKLAEMVAEKIEKKLGGF